MQSYIRLSDNERAFLAANLLNADATVKELSQRAGLSERTTRNVADSLLQRGIITPLYHLDLFALGYLDFTAFFNRGAESSAGQRQLDLARHRQEGTSPQPRVPARSAPPCGSAAA